jgi:predicted dithiol-disulfide oxidoreductase (DUF899 family)
VSLEEWEAAHQQLLVKEKELTRARDALAAERRRMPWLAVEKDYEFDGPEGKASLLDLFDGRRQLIVYRALLEPGVHGWPEHACIGCYLDMTALGRQEEWEDSPEGYPQTPPYEWWNWHDEYGDAQPTGDCQEQITRSRSQGGDAR